MWCSYEMVKLDQNSMQTESNYIYIDNRIYWKKFPNSNHELCEPNKQNEWTYFNELANNDKEQIANYYLGYKVFKMQTGVTIPQWPMSE